MTVGLAPFVTVDGTKRTIAQVGLSSAGLLTQLRQDALLPKTKNVVVLIGANDLGGTPVATTVANTRALWALARAAGARVWAMTLPPNRGWAPFASNAPAIEAKRQAINAALGAAFVAGEADGLIDLSKLMADPQDPTKLASSFDSGDHLHPRKDAHGALLTRAFEGISSTAADPSLASSLARFIPNDAQPPSAALVPLLFLVGIGGIVAYWLTRKPSSRPLLFR